MNCGCKIVRSPIREATAISFCPLHAAAEEMLQFLIDMLDIKKGEEWTLSDVAKLCNKAEGK